MTWWLDLGLWWVDRARADQQDAADRRADAASSLHRYIDDARAGLAEAVARAEEFDRRLQTNFLEATGLHYGGETGFTAQDVVIRGGTTKYTLKMTVQSGQPRRVKGDGDVQIETGDARIAIRALLITPWATVLCVEVAVTGDSAVSLAQLGLMPQSGAAASILSPGGQYCDLRESNMSGCVFPDAPRTGLLVFEPFRAPVAFLRILIPSGQIAGVEQFSNATFEAADLLGTSRHQLATQPIAKQVETYASAQVAQMETEAETVINGKSEGGWAIGCLMVLIGALVAATLIAAL